MAIAGKVTVFRIGDSANSLTDITTDCDSFSFPETPGSEETTSFGSDDQTFLPTVTGRTISIGGNWSKEIDALLSGIMGLEDRDFEYGPQGSATGNPKITGKFILTSYGIDASATGKITFSADLQVSGAVTRGTY